MDSQILSLYAKGMTTQDIVATFKEMYDADVSPMLISRVTDVVKEQVIEWQNRPLDALYPLRSSASCILIDIVISYHYTQIVEFGVLLKS